MGAAAETGKLEGAEEAESKVGWNEVYLETGLDTAEGRGGGQGERR